MKKISKIFNRCVALVMSGLMAISATGMSGIVSEVFAGTKSMYVTRSSSKIKYSSYGLGSYVTRHYYADGDSNTWCAQPQLNYPSEGSYTATSLKASSNITKIMYYGYVADDNFWNSVSGYSGYSSDEKYIFVHCAVSKANNQNWSKGLNSTGQAVVNALYDWCTAQSSVPGSTEVWFQASGSKRTSTSNINSLTEEWADEKLTNWKDFDRIRTWVDNDTQVTTGFSIRSDNENATMYIDLPSNVACIAVEAGSTAPRKVNRVITYDSTTNVVKDTGGDYFYYFVLKPDVSTTSSTITLRTTSDTVSYRGYKISTGSSHQDLVTLQTLEDSDTATLKVTWNSEGKIRIYKSDQSKEIGLEGATFGIYKDSDCTDLVDTVVTDENGEATYTLSTGNYYVKELEAPEGYIIDSDIENVIVESGKTKQIGFNDVLQEGELSLQKVDTVTNEPLSYITAQYTLTNTSDVLQYDEETDETLTYKSGEWSRTVTLNGSSGSAVTVENIPVGTFELKETKAPSGYTTDDETYIVTVKWVDGADQASVSMTDSKGNAVTSTSSGSLRILETPVRVKLNVQKLDSETGHTVLRSGAKFKVYAKNDIVNPATGESAAKADEEVCELTTKSDGVTEDSDWLYPGVYYIMESQAPDGYATDSSTKVEADLSLSNIENNETYTFTFKNTPTKYRLSLSKYDDHTNSSRAQGDATLEGAVYGIYAAEDIMDPCNDSSHVLYQADLNNPITTVTTDSEGKAISEELYAGKYVVKEISAPEGYKFSDTEVTIVCEWDGGEQEVITYDVDTFYEAVKVGNISMHKGIDDTNESRVVEPEESITFAVILKSFVDNNYDGNLEEALKHTDDLTDMEYCEITTDENGYAKTPDLAYGIYTVHQLTSGDETVNVPDFDVDLENRDDESTVEKDYIISNEYYNAPMMITKVDAETGKTVLRAGTTYKIKALSDVVVDEVKFSAGDYIYYMQSFNGYPAEKVDEFVTNEDGYFVLNETLGAGTYQLEEVQAPEMYVLGDPIEFTISMNAAYEVDKDGNAYFNIVQEDNPTKGVISIEKRGEALTGYDEETHRFIYEEMGLESASFDIVVREDIMDPSNDGTIYISTDGAEYARGTVVETITTGEDGIATSSELPLGEYTVVENTAPDGMVHNSEEHEVSLTYDNQEAAIVYDDTSFVNERQTVLVTATKSDAYTGEQLDGAEITLVAARDIVNCRGEVIVEAGTEIETVVTSADGAVSFTVDLPIDIYSDKDAGSLFKAVESAAPAGYILSDDEYDVDTSYQGQDVTEILIENEYVNRPTTTEVSKTSMSGDEELEGAVLSVTDAEGNVIDEWVSETERHIIYGLHQGEMYALHESIAPEGYDYASDVDFFVNDDGSVTEVHMVDMVHAEYYVPRTPVFSKTDITGEEELEGAHIVVTDEDGNIVDEWDSTTEQHMIENLEYGHLYTLTETQAPEGYVISESVTFYTDEENGEDDLIQMVDKQVFMSKTDVTGEEELEGAHIVVTDEDGNIVDEWDSTTEQHAISGLEENHTYVMTETSAPDGYVISSSVEFTVSDEKVNETVEMVDEQVTFSKVDVAGEEIPGAHIIVTDEDGNIVDEWTSTTESHAINGLEEGHTYTLTEHQAPDGYVISESITFTVSDGKIDEYIEMVDKQVFMSKTDVTGEEELEGAHIVVTDENGETVDEWDSTTERHAISGLEEGHTYVMTETIAPDEYCIASSIEFTVSTEKENETVTMVDKQVAISKLDIVDSSEVEGATLTITDEDGNVIDEWVTNGTEHYVTGLEEGKTYTLTEAIAPDDYSCAESIEFVVSGDKVVQKVVMEDAPLTDIQVNKIDSATNKPVVSKDFEFTMYSDEDCTNEIVSANANTDDGTATFENVEFGTYYIRETQAPQGYLLSDEVVKVVVDEELENVGKVYSITYMNTPQPVSVSSDSSTPVSTSVKTGDNSMLMIAAVVAVAAVAAGCIIYSQRKKSKNSKKPE